MNSKLIGGTLLVVGTTIGAGMLALPVATAQLGFGWSLILLIACWAIMTASAFLFLEVNLWLPPNNNVISMAGATLGKTGQGFAWLVYLILMYSVLSAYIAGGGDLFHYLLVTSGIEISLHYSAVLFTFVFGLIVYMGIRAVDYANRGLMFGKLGSYLLLVLLLIPFISGINLSNGEFKHILSPASLTVTALAFGCVIIIPSLRAYFADDIVSLRKAIFFGTFIPLICYVLWDLVIMGVIPLKGTPGLMEIFKSNSSNSDLISALSVILNENTITLFAKFFTSICMATSFLSVALSLSDFLSDGLAIKKVGAGNLIVYAATFLPPVLFVLFFPGAFLQGLNYAGICCLILMIFLPALMAWRGRYNCALVDNNTFQVSGGKPLLIILMLFSIIMIVFGLKGSI